MAGKKAAWRMTDNELAAALITAVVFAGVGAFGLAGFVAVIALSAYVVKTDRRSGKDRRRQGKGRRR